jgi:hypothetical protein
MGRKAISEGVALISQTLSRGSVGSYQLQAAIAAVHDEATRGEDTDWPQIMALYSLLKRMSDNPMVTLNHAIAAAMVHGPQPASNCWKPGRRCTNGGSLSPGCSSCPPLRDGRRSSFSDRTLPDRSPPHDEHPERDYLTMQAARLAS